MKGLHYEQTTLWQKLLDQAMKVWDITQPTDDWERGYAKVEYARTGMNQVGDKKIIVKQIFTCMYCGQDNTNWRWTCERCDALECIAVDEEQQND